MESSRFARRDQDYTILGNYPHNLTDTAVKPERKRIVNMGRVIGTGILATCAFIYLQDNKPNELNDARHTVANVVVTSDPCEAEGLNRIRNSLADIVAGSNLCTLPVDE